MRYLEEFRDPAIARTMLRRIARTVTRPWTIMEICGGQTHAIVRNGIDRLLPDVVELVHGPGCPVCVTPVELIDQGIAIASQPDVIFTSFGDMLRVPGSRKDLSTVKSAGGDVRIVYSPLDALRLAREHRDCRIVFFAVGFETTAPASAMALRQAHREGLVNFSMLVAHVRVAPAMTALLDSPTNRVQAYLAAGHVCAVTGWDAYRSIARDYGVPVVVTGFEPIDLLAGILSAVEMLEQAEAKVENRYERVVTRYGNRAALELIEQVFEITDRSWRGIGPIPNSGYRILEKYAAHDAARIFGTDAVGAREPDICMAGGVLRGVLKPNDCPAFGTACTPEHPLGATMVSSEGACAAYFRYHSQTESQRG